MALLAKLNTTGSSEEETDDTTNAPVTAPTMDMNTAMVEETTIMETNIPANKDRRPTDLSTNYKKPPDNHMGGEG